VQCAHAQHFEHPSHRACGPTCVQLLFHHRHRGPGTTKVQFEQHHSHTATIFFTSPTSRTEPFSTHRYACDTLHVRTVHLSRHERVTNRQRSEHHDVMCGSGDFVVRSENCHRRLNMCRRDDTTQVCLQGRRGMGTRSEVASQPQTAVEPGTCFCDQRRDHR